MQVVLPDNRNMVPAKRYRCPRFWFCAEAILKQLYYGTWFWGTNRMHLIERQLLEQLSNEIGEPSALILNSRNSLQFTVKQYASTTDSGNASIMIIVQPYPN